MADEDGEEEGGRSTPDRSPGQAGSGRADGDAGESGDPPSREASADEGPPSPEASADEGPRSREASADEGPTPPEALAAEGGIGRIQANKHRAVQVARTGGRKLFDEAAQAVFLEWFAATGNLAWSAEKAGFNYKTVLRHRMNDPRFREGWERAIEQNYARLEAKRLETKRKQEPIGIEGDWDAPEMDDMAPERIDTILREHKRDLAGIKKPGRRPRVASNAEVRAALAKSLVAFAERIKARKAAEEAGRADAPRDDEPGDEE